MSDRLLHTKVSKRKPLTHFPKKEDGHDGDMQIVSIQGKGTYLCIKDKSEWKISEKFNPRNKFDTHIFDEITTRKIRGKGGLSASLESKSITVSSQSDTGGISTSDISVPVFKIGNGTNAGFLSSKGDTSLFLNTGGSSTGSIELYSNGAITTTIDGFRSKTFLFNTDNTSSGGRVRIYNGNTSGNANLNIETKGLTDTFTRYYHNNANPLNNKSWSVGMDGDDGPNFKVTYLAGGTLASPSSGGTKLTVDTSGNLTTAGTLTIGSITTDTAGDNYLVEVSGVVKKRTPAETLADIGAQATVTAGTNCTFSGATLNVDDAFIKNDANDTMAGTLAITSTTADQFKVLYDASNYALLNVSATGDLEIETIGAGTTDSDITLNADGDILMDAAGGDVTITSADVKIDSGKKLFLDGGGDSYIFEHSTDHVRYIVGNNALMRMTADSSDGDGNQVHFSDASVGFTQLEPTYDATDTLVDFRHSNKQFVTFGAGNITNLNLYFPAMSGNFVLLLKQDGTGSRTITNYKVREFDESLADGETGVKFAGGSAPTLTTDANHVDIISIYWDAYGVATLDFQF